MTTPTQANLNRQALVTDIMFLDPFDYQWTVKAMRLVKNYAARQAINPECCEEAQLQYEETVFAYKKRILEKEGIQP